MRKEFNLMITIILCAIIGIVFAAIAGILNTQSVIDGWLIEQGLSIANFQFLLFFLSLVGGIILGVLKN